MEDNTSEELELAAFLYVAGEMDASEAAAFEQRLADEQPAREAVCRSVAVGERLVLLRSAVNDDHVEPKRVTTIAKPRFATLATALSWMALGAVAASLAFLVGDWNSSNHDSRVIDNVAPSQITPNTAPNSPIDPMLVDGLVWSQIDATTRWNDDFDWIGDYPSLESPLPRLDLPSPQQHSLFGHQHQPGEIK